ncbi:hypothetical protein AJ79_04217 [Helicocarpus griseus UAMH5409]|uniref:Nascent polypeptide-associated complex subunit alpha-like UBA domain-containing protein n=1 Tax=Helicocarpus griseus UAMH5409 TaxID=1447875 RepID=A0A2B7XUN1_9EURO|nr:hypothetical protein AJ79_04217 [Helicocarpus griseus UAMH5409]
MTEPTPRKTPATNPTANNNDDNAKSASELPKNAEDRAAAAALSSLNTGNEISSAEAGGPSGAAPPSAADQEALGKAMSRLEMIAGAGKEGVAGKRDAKKGKVEGAEKAAAEEKAAKKPVVKVSAEDVGLLVDQLDLTKIKATELLKAHDGDAVKAMRAFIAPPAA